MPSIDILRHPADRHIRVMSFQEQSDSNRQGLEEDTLAKDIVLVTGTSSGFGEMIALELARAGYTVYASMRESAGRNKKKADDYAARSSSEGIDVRALEPDVTKQPSVESAIERVVRESGRLDVVVHNAGT
jgi:NAD(P)-dependent dehydrogenase (short-subunit alcohol dehydrogenase family)